MGFKALELIVAGTLLAKGIAGLAMPGRFYAWRVRQCLSPRVPGVILVVPLFFAVLAALAWYAIIFHHEASGWVITGLLTAGVLLGAVNLSRWKTYRVHALRLATDPTLRRRFDLGIVSFGAVLVVFAIFAS